MADQESMNATLARLIQAITDVDEAVLTEVVSADILLYVPGPRDLDLAQTSLGPQALCAWARKVHDESGKTTFHFHRVFENGGEMMGTGEMQIERNPTGFASPCSVHAVFEQGRVSAFQLLVDTYALEKFRGLTD